MCHAPACSLVKRVTRVDWLTYKICIIIIFVAEKVLAMPTLFLLSSPRNVNKLTDCNSIV